MRLAPVVVLGCLASLITLTATSSVGVSAAGSAASAQSCFGGPPIGLVCGTLTESGLHSLVSDLTLAQKVGLVHGQAETTDPQFGCGDTGLPSAFPVINPGATGAARVAGCVGQAGVNNGVKSLGIPPLRQTDGPAGVRLSHQETGLPAPVGLTATFDRAAAQRLRRRDRPRRPGNQPGRPLRADDQPGFVRDRRTELRDAGRGSVPGRRARSGSDPGCAAGGADRHPQAHGDE